MLAADELEIGLKAERRNTKYKIQKKKDKRQKTKDKRQITNDKN